MELVGTEKVSKEGVHTVRPDLMRILRYALVSLAVSSCTGPAYALDLDIDNQG